MGSIGSGALRRALSWVLCLCGIAWPAPLFATEYTAGGLPRNQALYLTMDDGIRIAVDLWLPVDLNPGARVPAVLKMTSYWRAVGLAKPTGTFKALSYFSLVPNEDFNRKEADRFREAGCAVVYVDARGSGASFGTRDMPLSRRELDDFAAVTQWISDQAWSNGRVAAVGNSYEGNAAELLASHGLPELRAVIPMFSDFDPWAHLVAPGGVVNEWFVRFWDEGSRMLDQNDLAAVAKFKGHDYELMKRVVTGVKPVDDDPSGALLTAALRQHESNRRIADAMMAFEFRDDVFSADGQTFAAFSPYTAKAAIEASGTPMMTWVGWMDAATVQGALSRFMTIANPQRLVIGPWGHGGKTDADPFQDADAPAVMAGAERFAACAGFLHPLLGTDSPAMDGRELTYYTLGEGVWRTSSVWPPAGVTPQRWYLDAGHQLRTTSPSVAEGADTYTVDFTATTGETNRWRTQAEGADVVYLDRAAAGTKLLTYTSAPLDSDMRITGNPVLTLQLRSSERDGAIFAYLEHVDADGRVTYITEGMIRLIHRGVSQSEPPYAVFGPYRTYAREDAQPMIPGEVAEVSFDLIPTSALFRKGSRIRVAIAGHDASVFRRYPQTGTPELTIERNAGLTSFIDLPVAAE